MEPKFRPLRVAVMASGNGSNAENIARHASACGERLCVPVIICDRPDAFVIERAKKLGIPCEVIPRDGTKEAHEAKIAETLARHDIHVIFLAGYMRILSPAFIRAWPRRIINIHPSLLPAFPGRDGYGDAFRAGVPVSGVTLHYVDEGVDTGPVIAQKTFERRPDDTLETFRARGMELEYQLYREFIDTLVRSAAA